MHSEVMCPGQVFGAAHQLTPVPPPRQYLYGAHAILFVYDVTSTSSLEALQAWVTTVRKAARAQERPPIQALVANKADLEHARQVRDRLSHANYMSEAGN